VLSVVVEGARVGGMMAGVRYAVGRVVVRIQDLVLLDGFSDFWAAIYQEGKEDGLVFGSPICMRKESVSVGML
jgi:hypothetical protein